MKVEKLTRCRVCGSTKLETVLDLGKQALTGVFPKTKDEIITSGTLDLVFCLECNLLQLGHSYSLDEMYGDNYGYRSGLNRSMVEHLTNKIHMLEKKFNLRKGDVVLDIGSNDGTSLNSYLTPGIRRIGMDPTGKKFSKYYDTNVELITDFFSADLFRNICQQNAKIVTSIAMFYDLESPIKFAKQVESILASDGVWHLEQSYMPTMLKNNAYDTICHEHLEYYSLSVIERIFEEAGLRIIDISTNDVNGGSFTVTAAKINSVHKADKSLIEWFLRQENNMMLGSMKPYIDFAERIANHRMQFVDLLNILAKEKKLVCGYGASTKGNVLLQYSNITDRHIKVIGEVNPDKYGSFTPGTLIPIDDEQTVKAMKPDYLIVFPWHFRNGIIAREKEYLNSGGRFIFPMPYIEVV